MFDEIAKFQVGRIQQHTTTGLHRGVFTQTQANEAAIKLGSPHLQESLTGAAICRDVVEKGPDPTSVRIIHDGLEHVDYATLANISDAAVLQRIKLTACGVLIGNYSMDYVKDLLDRKMIESGDLMECAAAISAVIKLILEIKDEAPVAVVQ